jgi:hypothetical protein
VHRGDITSDEVWTAEGSPHVIEETVTVRQGRTLTIAPCATVQIKPKQSLFVAFPGTPGRGTLVAEGTAKQPIRIEGQGWGRIWVVSPGTARLAYVTIEGGGFESPGALVATGLADTSHKNLRVDHVTVKGAPVKLEHLAAFADGSTDLTIKGAPAQPLLVNEYALDTLPSGSYTGNGVDEIVVERDGWIEQNATMHARGVPYKFPQGLTVGRGPEAALSVLTIEPGNTLRFGQGKGLKVELATGSFPASGALVAVGTKEKPIVFTSASPSPKAGDWQGLWFGGVARAENRIENARIEYTGADCGCVLVSCSAVTQHEGAVIFTQPPPGVFITSTTIAHGAMHGFVLGYTGARFDFSSANSFEDLAGCQETLPSAPSCPNPRPACE